MSKMKKLQPEMMRLREEFGDDKMRMNQELMALYKKEQVNPMSGCLPIVVQDSGVLRAVQGAVRVDRDAPCAVLRLDPGSVGARSHLHVQPLFGLLPWDPPTFLMIGIWPLLMGATMLLQTKLNPQPADPVQAKVMMFLPVMFISCSPPFPRASSILDLNNVLSIGQQWLIMKRMGVPA